MSGQVVSGDPLAALDAIPVEQVPAAITRLTARLLAAPTDRADDELLTPPQVAALLQTSVRYVYRHAKALGAIRVSRRKLRFRRAAFERHLKRNGD